MKTQALVRRMLPLLLAAIVIPVPAVTARPAANEITATARGRAILAEQAERARQAGRADRSGHIRVWEIAPGDYFLAERLPLDLRIGREPDPRTGRVSSVLSFDVEARMQAPRVAGTTMTAASGPWWLWLTSYCFARRNVTYGWIDSCYRIDGMVNEADPRDFYALNQWASLGARSDKKGAAIYSGFVDAVRASTSAPMSWLDWSPRSSLAGSCQTIPLAVSALGVSLATSGLMCERWTIYKASTAGRFRTTWSCGCLYGFGVRYPETRQAEYMQAVSVPGGGVARWTISVGIHAAN